MTKALRFQREVAKQQRAMLQRTHAAARKHCARVDVEWSEEDSLLLAGRRCAADPMATTVSQHKLRALQEIFPATDRAVLRDVLAAAQFQIDVAAEMLGELVREPSVAPASAPLEHVALADATAPAVLDFEMTDAADDEDWSEVSAVVALSDAGSPTSADAHPWVMVHDEWEVVDADGERVQTLAEMLRRAGANAPVTPLPPLAVAAGPKPTRTRARTRKELESAASVWTDGGAEWSVKSFGARKRRGLKTRA